MAVIITEFQLDEFHGGNPLRILDLGNGLNVALVRSEAGRFQLLQLVPWVLYGPGDYFATSREMIAAPGTRGSLTVRSDHGVFRIERPWQNDNDDIVNAPPVLTASDGQDYDSDYIGNILEGLPQDNFREVFTFDLARLGRFASGGEPAARQLIGLANYLKENSPKSSVATPVTAPPPNLSGITSRLSELTNLIHSGSEISRAALAPQERGRGGNREKIRQQLKQLEGEISAARAKWNQLQKETDQIQCVSTMARIQSQLHRVKRNLKEARHDTAGKKKFSVNQEAAARLDDKLNGLRAERKELQSEAAEFQRQGRELGDLSRTSRLVPQIDALLIQEKSLVKEEAACEQLEDQIRDLESQIESERLRPTPQPIATSFTSATDATAQARLDQMSERIRESQRELEIAEDSFKRAQQATSLAENSLRQATSLSSHPEDAIAIHEAENRVIGLREILGRENQLTTMEEDRENLRYELQHLYAQQMLPFRTMLALGLPFMIGVAMIIYGLVMTPQNPNYQMIMLGFMAAVIASLIKISMEQTTREDIQSVRKRLNQVSYQIDEIAGAREESAVSGVSLNRQLDEAERDLKRLQERFAAREPEPQPIAVGYDTNTESSRLKWEHAQQRQLELTGQWRDLMIELNLSPNMTLTDARSALSSRAQVETKKPSTSRRSDTSQLEFQLQHFRRDLDRRRDWLNVISGQTRQLISELGFSGTVTGIGEQIDVLREALSEHKEKTQSRRELSRSLKRLKEKIRRVKEAGRRTSEQRAKLDEDVKLNEQRAKAESKIVKDRVKSLEKERDRLDAELNDIRALYNIQSKSNLAELAELSEDELTSRTESLHRKLEKAQDQLLKLSEQRGRHRAELNALDERTDRSNGDADAPNIPWHAILEKADEISHACEVTESTTQSLAPSSQAKYVYLEQASKFLHQLSGGQFWQIDVPHEDDLILTDHSGTAMRLADVRHEHYANIYFSLWLARLEAYADQGLRLPIIMEDPLEATDPQRKPVVAALLRDMAAKGQQVVLVTSESFNASIFAQQDVPIADLSDREVITTSNGAPADDLEMETAIVETAPDVADPNEPLF